MQLHQLARKVRSKRSRRVGRGGKRGKTSGRGTKGQKARAGAKIRPAIRDVIKKLPKCRGYHFRPFRPKPLVINLSLLERHFPDGAAVTPAALLAKHLVHRMKGRIPEIKILDSPILKKRYAIRGLLLSQSARARVTAAGGTIG